jgi:hypothetical protein
VAKNSNIELTIVFAVIFPNNLSYFTSFIKSLENQTNKQFKLVLINDGVKNINKYLKETSLIYDVINVHGLTPFEIRIQGLITISKLKPAYIIFADTDDTFSENRIETQLKYLKIYPIVCNDIDTTDENGNVLKRNIWGERLGNEYKFDIQFLKNKNIVGLGNTGIQFFILVKILEKIKNLKEGNDWILFSSVGNHLKGLFISTCTTNYRQHDFNIIGKKAIDKLKLLQIIETKINHYQTLINLGVDCFDVLTELNKNQKIRNLLNNNLQKSEEIIKYLASLNRNFFWWEEPNLLLNDL